MIVNSFSSAAIVVDGATLVLAVATVYQSCKFLYKKKESCQFAELQEDKLLYLVVWMGIVLIGLRVLSWPFFYLVLDSFVDEVEGAMCLFGVRNLLPTLTRFTEFNKLFAVFVGFVWLLFVKLNKSTARVHLLVFMAVLIFTESVSSLLLWALSSSELAVSCCTIMTDIPTRFTVWMPKSLFGPGYENILLIIYYLGYFLLLSILMYAQNRGKNRTFTAKLAILIGLSALVNIVTTYFALVEIVAPKLTGLPFHHCIYCFMQNVIDAPIIILSFLLGSFCAMAVTPIWIWSGDVSIYSKYKCIDKLMFVAIISLSASLLMVSIHLLF